MPRSKTRSLTIYQQRNPNGDPFRYTPAVNPTLEVIGLILWATEGDKTQLSLANGNSSIISKYLEFLRTICNFREDKIKGLIHCHDTLSYEACLQYWSKITGISHERFNKPFIKPDKGGTRNYPYGVVRVYANNTKLMQLFKERLKVLGLDSF